MEKGIRVEETEGYEERMKGNVYSSTKEVFSGFWTFLVFAALVAILIFTASY